MKAKISKIDPIGNIVESKEFHIPFIKKDETPLDAIINYEPMCQNKYLLEIGEYKYWLSRAGELILIH